MKIVKGLLNKIFAIFIFCKSPKIIENAKIGRKQKFPVLQYPIRAAVSVLMCL